MMNKNLKELFPEKAAMQGWEGDEGRNGNGKPVFYYSQEQMEKLAKLIVLECIKQVYPQHFKYDGVNAVNLADACHRITDHFSDNDEQQN